MFAKAQRVHFIGIGGIGMSGIAEILLTLGYSVSGSDLRRTAITERLASLGASVYDGHAAVNVVGSQVVVASSAVQETNPEVAEARRRKIPLIQRAEMLAELMRLKYGIAVAGMHGKTTTTSMIATVLAAGGLDPTVVVGGRIDALGSNARLGNSRYLVAEADESDRSFLKLSPILAVVTNLDREHMDCYRDMADVEDAFVEFMDRVPFYGACVACCDDEQLLSILPRVRRRVFTYGTSAQADYIVRLLPEPAPGWPAASTTLKASADPAEATAAPVADRAADSAPDSPPDLATSIAEVVGLAVEPGWFPAMAETRHESFPGSLVGSLSGTLPGTLTNTLSGTLHAAAYGLAQMDPAVLAVEAGANGHESHQAEREGTAAEKAGLRRSAFAAPASDRAPVVRSRFEVVADGVVLGPFELLVPGRHNVLNAAAAVAIAHQLEVPAAQIIAGLRAFSGVDRRFQLKGCVRGITVIDDYGHHPTEIRATLRAARDCHYRAVHVIFQPHRYTRTRDLMEDFATAFGDASSVQILDIYAASEEPLPGVSGGSLVAAILAKTGQPHVEFGPSFEAAVSRTVAMAKEGDAILTMGAGNVVQIAPLLLERLEE